jgi:hypothetical protein
MGECVSKIENNTTRRRCPAEKKTKQYHHYGAGKLAKPLRRKEKAIMAIR